MQAMSSAIGMSEDDRLLAITTPAFDISLLELLLPLVVGARVVIARTELMRSPHALLDEIRGQQISFMQATPAAWQVFLDSNPQDRVELNMLCGGEALSKALASRLLCFGRKLWNVYGPTETTIWVGASAVARGTDGRAATTETGGDATVGDYVTELIGGPIRNTAWFVLDHKLDPVPIGMPGELCIAGPHVSRGYWKRPDLTEQAFAQSPFDSDRLYRTGDRVRCLPDGRMQFLGRRDRQLKVRGFRIEPAEVEAALCAHPSIQNAIVTARANRRGEGSLVGYVVAAADQRIAHSEIRQHLRDCLPEHFVPSFLVELDRIPVTVNGKIDYAALPEPDPVKHLAVGGYAMPGSKTERWLCQVWADVLEIEPSRVGIDQNFFELGGHSMLLVQLWNRIAPRAARGLALTELYRYPTIRGLAARIDGDRTADEADDVEGRAERRKKGLLRRGAVGR
jgi:acyl-coenzyme A synthetase/AMP-(fatty) acid ligase